MMGFMTLKRSLGLMCRAQAGEGRMVSSGKANAVIQVRVDGGCD